MFATNTVTLYKRELTLSSTTHTPPELTLTLNQGFSVTYRLHQYRPSSITST